MKRFKNLRTEDLNHVYKNELDKARFAHDVAYANSKDLAKRTVSERFWKIEPMNLNWIVDTMDIHEDWQLWCTRFLMRKQDQEQQAKEK